jgi:predicted RNase H-like nuclease
MRFPALSESLQIATLCDAEFLGSICIDVLSLIIDSISTVTGHGLSRQTWGLRDKLGEANQCLASGQYPLHEVHPEVSFAAMNGRPLEHPKISWAGQMIRRALLARHGVHLPDQLGAAGNAGPDDVLDAAAAAWSAHRIATGHANRLPTTAPPGQEHISIQY